MVDFRMTPPSTDTAAMAPTAGSVGIALIVGIAVPAGMALSDSLRAGNAAGKPACAR